MKRIIAVALILSLLTVLAACDTNGSSGDTRLGVGIITSIGSSQDLAEDAPGRAQADTTIATVMIDEDGTVVDVKIDTAQTRIEFNEDGEIISDPDADYLTKKQLGDDYGMIRASGIGREWDEQIEAIEDWMIGKDADEIANMPLEAMDGGGNRPADVDLVSMATMRVDPYLEAVLKAIENAED